MKHTTSLFGTLFLALFFAPAFALASTPVSGTLSADTTWTKAGSPYVVATNFRVREDVTITINPGVIVKFADAFPYYPIIFGRIIAHGTPDERIST